MTDTQRIETKPKTASVRISESLLDKLKDAQHAARKNGQPEPTYTELLDSAWSAFSEEMPKSARAKTKADAVTLEINPLDLPIHEALHRALQIPKKGKSVKLILDLVTGLLEDPPK